MTGRLRRLWRRLVDLVLDVHWWLTVDRTHPDERQADPFDPSTWRRPR